MIPSQYKTAGFVKNEENRKKTEMANQSNSSLSQCFNQRSSKTNRNKEKSLQSYFEAVVQNIWFRPWWFNCSHWNRCPSSHKMCLLLTQNLCLFFTNQTSLSHCVEHSYTARVFLVLLACQTLQGHRIHNCKPQARESPVVTTEVWNDTSSWTVTMETNT